MKYLIIILAFTLAIANFQDIGNKTYYNSFPSEFNYTGISHYEFGYLQGRTYKKAIKNRLLKEHNLQCALIPFYYTKEGE